MNMRGVTQASRSCRGFGHQLILEVPLLSVMLQGLTMVPLPLRLHLSGRVAGKYLVRNCKTW
jgi:hypothetical protein